MGSRWLSPSSFPLETGAFRQQAELHPAGEVFLCNEASATNAARFATSRPGLDDQRAKCDGFRKVATVDPLTRPERPRLKAELNKLGALDSYEAAAEAIQRDLTVRDLLDRYPAIGDEPPLTLLSRFPHLGPLFGPVTR